MSAARVVFIQADNLDATLVYIDGSFNGYEGDDWCVFDLPTGAVDIRMGETEHDGDVPDSIEDLDWV